MTFIRNTDVDTAFVLFTQTARVAGIDTTGWALHRGNPTRSLVEVEAATGAHHTIATLGTTNREAYDALGHMRRALHLLPTFTTAPERTTP